MPITLEVNGVEYTNFTMATATLSLDALSNDFSFQAVHPSGEQLPLKGGDSCSVFVNGDLVLTGFIESITGDYTATDHTIFVTGRDRTADLIDSSIDVMDDIRSPITLAQVIEKVVQHIGSDLEVVDDAKPEPFNKAEDIVTPQPGDNSFAFVEGYAQKRQVLLTSNAEGNVVITNSKSTPSDSIIQNDIRAANNNILTAQWSYMTGNLFNKYIQKGQLDPVALDLGGSTTEKGLVSQQGEAIDDSVRIGRQRVVVSDKGFSGDQLQKRAEWSKKIRGARSVAYSCTVRGFKNTSGKRWDVNTLVSVIDTFADINRDLLLNSVRFLFNEDGSVSLLQFVEADAYKLQQDEPKAKPVGTNQDAFIL